jgi:hypothetical protein
MLTFLAMQNGAQNTGPTTGRLLGFVRVLVGNQVFDLPVQAVPFEKDGDRAAGGFFIHDDQLGILVDEAAPAATMQEQIESATAEAVRHLSRKYLN